MEAVGGLAGGVAHDFNNILMAIVGNVELARSLLGSEAGGSEPLEEPLEQIAQAARRAATLTRDLLAFSRRGAAEPHQGDLNEVLRAMAKMFARVLGERVQLSLSCDAGLQPVMVDPRLLERVVVNLLVNARDAMPDGGVVRLATRNVTIDQAWVDRHGSLEPGPHVTLVVEDDGCGMDRETAERIFDNCPRYLHDIEIKDYSRYVPRPDHEAPIPDWKRNPVYCDALPERDLAALAEEEKTKPR